MTGDEYKYHVDEFPRRTNGMAWRFMGSILRTKAFSKYLLLTNTLSGVALDGVADYAEQHLEGVHPHDWGRTARMASMGFIFGPTSHYWYKFLDGRYPGRDTRTVVKKILAEMLLLGPIEIAIFYPVLCKLEHKSWSQGMEELKEKFLVTYKLEWMFWPPVQMINFYFLPPSLRVIYANVAYFIWYMVLSYLKHHNLRPNSPPK